MAELTVLQGLVVFTVFRVGFLGSARFGSGVMVARLDDGSWSSPSAIEILGGGFGGLIGVEMTDFVFVLNDTYAVRTFSQCGSALLSANLSTAFGPVGRSVEVAGGASTKGAAATFAYSKTKGIYAGVSLEGAIMIERRGANRKLYKQKVKASQVLTGAVAPPPEVKPLMDILALNVFHPKLETPPLSREMPPDGTAEAPENQVSELPTEISQPVYELDAGPAPTPPTPRAIQSEA